MSETWAVFRKELLELVGDRHARRGLLIQALALVGTTGVLVPWVGPAVWQSASPLAMLYVVFPTVLAASVAADSFAGERERRTLETLLATPVRDGALAAGKSAAAVVAAVVASAACILAAVITMNVRHPPFVPEPMLLASLLAGTVGAGLLTTALALAVSMRVPVTRSAQQIASMLVVVVGMVVEHVLSRFEPLDGGGFLRADGLLIAIGCVALSLAMGLFRRDRFFDA